MSGIELIDKGVGLLQSKLAEHLATKDARWIVECQAQAAKVGNAVAISLVAQTLGCDPSSDEVQRFIKDWWDDPALAARMRHLWPALLESPSENRRKRLAAVLVGGPTVTESVGDRDRLDTLAVQLLDEDVAALRDIAEVEQDQAHAEPVTAGGNPEKVALVANDNVGPWKIMPREAVGTAYMPETVPAASISIASLEGAGCIQVRQRLSSPDRTNVGGGYGFVLHVWVTPLGRFFIDALAKLRSPSGDFRSAVPRPILRPQAGFQHFTLREAYATAYRALQRLDTSGAAVYFTPFSPLYSGPQQYAYGQPPQVAGIPKAGFTVC